LGLGIADFGLRSGTTISPTGKELECDRALLESIADPIEDDTHALPEQKLALLAWWIYSDAIYLKI
jgi:hypothetical protein